MDLAQLNDPMIDPDITVVLLRSLPEPFAFSALMDDADKTDYGSICALLKSEIDRRKGRGGQEVSAPVQLYDLRKKFYETELKNKTN